MTEPIGVNSHDRSINGSLWERIIIYTHDYLDCQSDKPARKTNHTFNRYWVAPPTGWIKINVDSAFNPITGLDGEGWVAKFHDSSIILANGAPAHCSSALEAEAWTFREALTTAKIRK